ncbi:hypothetical protein [Halopiger xanaduensis]|uniref:Uncharacterized protein n=1 Tax=Halopiger xanaduensis (strain DSM 18323 / JCM 14033 / SH-6) TaxID=797210 RepID=F8DC67_HALXS|nr:hypothetical protein [Halopiger xanaduensis]AEH37181.1 hypothetical protein Halxa_2563 [Halopiger xanaduensis SH-6]
MVTNETTDRSRGQIILIGAIALAFIILGIVVVFNGVLYTETISSGTASQGGSSAAVTDAELEQSIGCILAGYNETDKEAEIEKFGEIYRNVSAQSETTLIDVSDVEVDETGSGSNATVNVTYDTHDLRYNQQQDIESADCPENV